MSEKVKKAATKKKAVVPAQQHVALAEVKSDTVVMKDGTMRAVLLVSSINFALKNEDEQNAIVSAYISFLNSLDHHIQVVIQSRRLHIKPYLDKLVEQERQQTNELLRAQIGDYRSFVSQLVELGQIMSKQFYIVVPFDPLTKKSKSFWTRLNELLRPAITVKLKEDRFQKRKYDLDMRVRQVEAGLNSMGLTSARLDTQSLIELFYSTYNPDIALTEPLPALNQMDVQL